MNTNQKIVRTVVIFIALALGGIGMVVGARLLQDALEQVIFIAVGSAIFGAALTFFLIRILAIEEK